MLFNLKVHSLEIGNIYVYGSQFVSLMLHPNKKISQNLHFSFTSVSIVNVNIHVKLKHRCFVSKNGTIFMDSTAVMFCHLGGGSIVTFCPF